MLCVAGASPLDEAACAMLAQLLGKHGLSAQRLAGDRSARAAIAALDPTDAVMVCVSAIETSGSIGRLRLLIRRLRRQLPRAQIVVAQWPRSESLTDGEGLTAEIGADRCVVSLAQAMRICVDAARSAVARSEPNHAAREAGPDAPVASFLIKAAGAGS